MALLAAVAALGCNKGQTESTTASGDASGGPSALIGCDHDLKSNAIAKHTWPYPAEHRDLQWGDRYKQMKLRLKPTDAAFYTATVTWKSGEHIVVEDSQLHFRKPRLLVAKRDLFVTRKVWDQGVEVERTFQAAKKGERGTFLFYNSRGMCMVGTDGGPGWTPCTLDDAFEGLSEEHPDACELIWWVKVRKSKVNQGWMPVDLDLMKRVAPPTDASE